MYVLFIYRSLFIAEEKEGVIELHNIGQVCIVCGVVFNSSKYRAL